MSKNCIIISSYPSTEYRRKILFNAIKSLRKFLEKSEEHYDILLCSQWKVDTEILSLVDYFILDNDEVESFYTKKNVHTFDFHWHFDIKPFHVTDIFDNAYHFMLWKLMQMSLGLLKTINYDFFYYMEGDFEILSENFLYKLNQVKQQTLKDGKDIILFNMDHNNPDDIDFFMPNCYGGRTESFINKEIPVDKQIWEDNPYYTSHPLEIIMYDKIFLPQKDKWNKIDFKNELSILRNDELLINILNTPSGLKNILYYNENEKDFLFMFLWNDFKSIKRINVYLNDEIYYSDVFNLGVYYLDKIQISYLMNKDMHLIVYNDNGEVFYEKRFFIDDDRIELIKRKGILYFKN